MTDIIIVIWLSVITGMMLMSIVFEIAQAFKGTNDAQRLDKIEADIAELKRRI